MKKTIYSYKKINYLLEFAGILKAEVNNYIILLLIV